MIVRSALTAAAALAAPGVCHAADLCKGTALRDFANDGGGYTFKRGERIEAITQYVVRGRGDSYCSHGGGCYPAHVVVGGRRVPTLALTNCSVDRHNPERAGGETMYPLVVDPRRNTAFDLKYDRTDNALLDLGLCSACASNAAYAYVRRPRSTCGRTVGMALAGNKRARRDLAGDNTACSSENIP